MKLLSLLFAVTCAIYVQGATVADVLSSIAAIDHGVSNLNLLLAACPLTLVNAMSIHSASGALLIPIAKAAEDATNLAALPASEPDATSILLALEALTPKILTALKRNVELRPEVAHITAGAGMPFARDDLNNLNTATTAFADAVVATAPAELFSRASAIKALILDELAVVIAAYRV